MKKLHTLQLWVNLTFAPDAKKRMLRYTKPAIHFIHSLNELGNFKHNTVIGMDCLHIFIK